MGKLAKLNSLTVQRLNIKGRYSDGGGLYLQISVTGTKSWLFRFMRNRYSREMGLGSLNAVTLARAREKAADCRRLLTEGTDPIEAREANANQKAIESARNITFAACAAAFMEGVGTKWKNEKHRNQWRTTLSTYAFPLIGTLPVQEVDTGLILKVLEPIWKEKTETASRVRGRIEAVLNYASAREWRTGENPARWRGHLDRLLAKPTEIRPVKHHIALAVHMMPTFAAELRAKESLTAMAVELLILTALRPGELVGARWEEIDLGAKTWIVPASRMKKKVEHRIPLSARTLTIILKLRERLSSPFLFPALVGSGHLTTASMLKLVKNMSPDYNLTAHGFRSTFRDWAAEFTDSPAEVAEMALGHAVNNKVEAAYRRGDLFLKRRKLMDAWERFCGSDIQSTKIVEIRSHAI